MKSIPLWLPLLLFYLKPYMCDAANHYCANGLMHSLELDDFYHRDETIIPRVLEKKRAEPKTCRWNVLLKSAKPDRQFVLLSVPSEERPIKSATMESIFSIKFMQSNMRTSVTPGTFQVWAVKQQAQFSVEVNWDPKKQFLGSEKLRIMVPIPGLCNRDMLSFKGRCYIVSALRQSVTAAMSSIRGDAQLASFSSIAEVSEFIGANNAKLNEFPYRRPLSLGQPVRLGMFLNAADATVLSVVRTDSGCQVQSVAKASTFSVTGRVAGPCLCLRVAEPDRAVVEFCDCSSPMLSLLSFPETARSVPSAPHCNSSELAWRLEQLRSFLTGTSASPRGAAMIPKQQYPIGKTLIIVFASFGLVSLLLIAAFLGFALKRRHARKQLLWNSKSAVIQLSNPSRSASTRPRHQEAEDVHAPGDPLLDNDGAGRAAEKLAARPNQPSLDGPLNNTGLQKVEMNMIV